MSEKTAFITGANRGLGRSMARQLAEAGFAVLGTYRSGLREAEAVAREIEAAGGRIAMLPLDLADAARFPAFAETVSGTLREFGRDRLDVVVQNAGNGILKRFEDTSEADLDDSYRIHFKGPFLLTQALLPLIAEGGRIINVSTAATRFVLKDHGAYSAMKAATEVMTRYMAHELGDRRIRVNVVAPGAIETDFAGGAVRDQADVNRIFADMTPLGRVGQPDDVGRAIAALASGDLDWVNGQRIELTGGQSL